MYTFLRWASRLLLAGFILNTPAWSASLRLLTEESAPFNFTQDGRLTGLFVEVVQEIQRRLGNKDQIESIPWARGYRLALTEPNVVLFSTARNPEREHRFQWVGPVQTSICSLFAKRGASMQVASLSDAKAASSILVPREWDAYDHLINLGFTNLAQTNTPEQMVKMLLVGRAPLMFTMRTGIRGLLERAGAGTDEVEEVYIAYKAQSYIAFSQKAPPEIVRQWQQALNKMKEDGSFAAIYERWLPGERPPDMKPDPDVWPNR